ncbi:MAG: hypothetical protein WKF34_11445 [Pyrinomonadaceae bacterium]
MFDGLGGPRAKALRLLPLAGLLLILLSAAAFGQDDLELMPPPLKLFSKDELAKLNTKSDLKDRTRLTLELMNMRLAAAEAALPAANFDGIFRELGAFHALMDHSLVFVQKQYPNGKALDSFKRIDIALRGFLPRLESLRRDVPPRYEDYIRGLLKTTRDARTRATEPLFADTVLPNRGNEF